MLCAENKLVFSFIFSPSILKYSVSTINISTSRVETIVNFNKTIRKWQVSNI